MIKLSHPFHLVTPRPWPITISFALLCSAIILISTIGRNFISILLILIIISIPAIGIFLWWRDVKRESSLQGNHSFTTIKLLKYRIIIFILSEIIFFLSFFWAFFHRRISPSFELGLSWPPVSISTFDPIGMPLLNSIILLSSGATITWSHHSFLNKNLKSAYSSIILTVLLGIIFTFFQGLEYYNAEFSFSDSVYGSTFFLATGFHGIHVIIGTLFLITSSKRIISIINSSYHFISFDLRAWYWHFVDVVWLFLFTSIYWWGSI